MGMISTISFDLWGTLIAANPKFSEERLVMFRKMSHKSDAVILGVIKSNKETYGDTAVSTEFIFDLLKTALDIPLSISTIMDEYYALFKQYPPFLLEKDIVSILEKAHKNYKLHLISNTLVVKGFVLKEALNRAHQNIFNHFDGLTFSDEEGVAKPDAAIFDIAYAKMQQVPKAQVLHIGDNPKTDFEGATQFGFQAALVDFKQNKGVLNVLNSDLRIF
jgi:putative hydrolase of the HAD superfamily